MFLEILLGGYYDYISLPRFREKICKRIRIIGGIIEWISCAGQKDPADACRPVWLPYGFLIESVKYIKVVVRRWLSGRQPVPIRNLI